MRELVMGGRNGQQLFHIRETEEWERDETERGVCSVLEGERERQIGTEGERGRETEGERGRGDVQDKGK